MCDATTLISSKQTDLHSCWIIYTKSDGKERLTVTEAIPPDPNLPYRIGNPNYNTALDDDDEENDGHKMLDSELQSESSMAGNPQIYREHRRRRVNQAKGDGKERLTAPNNDDDDDDDDEENDGPDQSLHEMLDPELQPEPPIPGNAQSQQIYCEHRRLAKEYLRVDTKLYYAQDFKEKLLVQMDPAERQEKQEMLKKMSEKEELLELYNNLKQQLEKIHAGQTTCPAVAAAQTQLSQNGGIADEVVADDGWIVISPNDNT